MNLAKQISSSHKEWASLLRELIGGNAAVTAYYDEHKENKINIFSSSNDSGVIAATVGLMDTNQSLRPEIEVCTEIIMDQRGHDKSISNILSTIAFCIVKDGWKVSPGVVFYDLVKMYIPNTNLPHVMFTAPFQWDTMSKVGLTGKTIYPLLAIPISEGESKVAQINAGQELESIWVQQSTDVLNWGRTGVA